MKNLVLLCLTLFLAINIQSQEIKNPNFAVVSHPMIVDQISYTDENLIIQLTIENKIIGGSFCADKDIYVQDVLKELKLPLLYSENIPTCPQTYNFRWIGEKLTFQLYFPKPTYQIKYLNIIENCDDNCFSIYGLILDAEMNKLVDQAFSFFDERNYDSSKETLIKLITDYPDYPFGNLYLNLIQVLLIQDNIADAKSYYQQLSDSNFHDKKFILDQLKDEAQLLK